VSGPEQATMLLETAVVAADEAVDMIRDLPGLTVGDTIARAQVLATVAQASALAGLLALRLAEVELAAYPLRSVDS
jgi:hypothetical protein